MMHSRRLVCLAAVSALMACTAPSGTGTTQAAASQTLAEAGSSTKDAASQPAALFSLLQLFVSAAGQSWMSYDSVSGITWLSASPSEYAEGKYQRNGRLELSGFGVADLPNGKAGAEYATKKENEGQSGLTLSGDHDRVQALSVKKFYFSEDYQSILQRQLSAMGKVVRVAQHCSSEDEDFASNPVFFEISLRSGGNVYVEASLEDGGKYAPGYTVFDFNRSKPVDRIRQLHCQEG